MTDDQIALRVDIGLDPDADATELDQETLQLREELLELNVDAVNRPSAGPPPQGTRAVEAAVLGTLLVELGRAVLGPAVQAIAGWVARRGTRSVKVTLDGDTIELSNASQEDQREILKTFLARHSNAVN